jgi:hypothetical protein
MRIDLSSILSDGKEALTLRPLTAGGGEAARRDPPLRAKAR